MSQRLRKLYEREKMLIKINKARGILGEYLFVRINNEKNSLEYWPIINSTITTGHYDSVMYRQGLYNLFDDRDIYLKMNHQRFCGFKLLFNMPARSFKSLFRTIVFISKSYDAAWKMPSLCIKMYKDRARDYMGRISVSCCLYRTHALVLHRTADIYFKAKVCVCVCVCVCITAINYRFIQMYPFNPRHLPGMQFPCNFAIDIAAIPYTHCTQTR